MSDWIYVEEGKGMSRKKDDCWSSFFELELKFELRNGKTKKDEDDKKEEANEDDSAWFICPSHMQS